MVSFFLFPTVVELQLPCCFHHLDILVCNTNSSDATASIFIREQDSNNSSAARNDISIVKNVLVPGNTSIEIIDGSYPIYYRKGEPYYDHVMAFGSATGIDIIMGYQKID